MQAFTRFDLVRGSLRALWANKMFGGYFNVIHRERLLWAGIDPESPETFDVAREVVWEEGLQQLFINNTKTVTDFEQVRRDYLAWEILNKENPQRFDLHKKGELGKPPSNFFEWKELFLNSLSNK